SLSLISLGTPTSIFESPVSGCCGAIGKTNSAIRKKSRSHGRRSMYASHRGEASIRRIAAALAWARAVGWFGRSETHHHGDRGNADGGFRLSLNSPCAAVAAPLKRYNAHMERRAHDSGGKSMSAGTWPLPQVRPGPRLGETRHRARPLSARPLAARQLVAFCAAFLMSLHAATAASAADRIRI